MKCVKQDTNPIEHNFITISSEKNISFKSYIVIKGKTYQFISKVLILNLNTIERIRNKILISNQKVFQLELINLKLSYLAYDMNLSDTIGNESMN